ncbi:hypothetical protein RJT34_07762 [Clitoria ternatea]|uniref:Transmembrane protein n=1 Tax=Clitoria ternatea TaxID=43366 RepID=A0AAN9K4Z9_CLITE
MAKWFKPEPPPFDPINTTPYSPIKVPPPTNFTIGEEIETVNVTLVSSLATTTMRAPRCITVRTITNIVAHCNSFHNHCHDLEMRLYYSGLGLFVGLMVLFWVVVAVSDGGLRVGGSRWWFLMERIMGGCCG